jgi:hypothetical protein
MKLKRLSVENWMYTSNYELSPINPITYKTGWYLHNNFSWVEFKLAGTYLAFEIPANDFKYKLNLLNAAEYNYRQYKALYNLKKEGLATQEQKKLLCFIEQNREIKEVVQSVKKFFNKNML